MRAIYRYQEGDINDVNTEGEADQLPLCTLYFASYLLISS